MKLKLFGALSTLALIAATPANAASIAVFGNMALATSMHKIIALPL